MDGNKQNMFDLHVSRGLTGKNSSKTGVKMDDLVILHFL